LEDKPGKKLAGPKGRDNEIEKEWTGRSRPNNNGKEDWKSGKDRMAKISGGEENIAFERK